MTRLALKDIVLIVEETPKPSKNRPAQIVFRYRTANSPSGVTRGTVQRLARALGVDETQAIHLALRQMAVRVLPQYEADDGPLTTSQAKQVGKLAGQVDTRYVRTSLFGREFERRVPLA